MKIALSSIAPIVLLATLAGCGKPPSNEPTIPSRDDSEIRPGEMRVISGAAVAGETMTVTGRFSDDSVKSGLSFIGVSLIAKRRRPQGDWVNASGKTAPIVQEDEHTYSFEADMKVPVKPGSYELECLVHTDVVALGKVEVRAKQ